MTEKYQPITKICDYRLGDEIRLSTDTIIFKNGKPYFPNDDDRFQIGTRDVANAEETGILDLTKENDPNIYFVLRESNKHWPLHGKKRKK